MSNTILKGKWDQLSGKVQEKWSEMTDDDIQYISGKYDKLADKLKEYYGYTEEQAEKEINHFLKKLNSHTQEAANGIREGIEHYSSNVNHLAKKSPWSLAAITALGGLLVGLCLRGRL